MPPGYSTAHPLFFLASTDCLVPPLFNGFLCVLTPVITLGDFGS